MTSHVTAVETLWRLSRPAPDMGCGASAAARPAAAAASPSSLRTAEERLKTLALGASPSLVGRYELGATLGARPAPSPARRLGKLSGRS